MGIPRHSAHKRVAAHPAHPTPPAHIKPAAALVEKHPDVQSYLTSLMLKISQCKTDWEHYGQAVSHAYAWAWNDQSRVLREVRESIEKRKKAEEADALFALNLLTCGIGGGLAAACAKKILSTAGEELSEKFVEKMVDMAKEKAQEPGKKAAEWLYKHMGHPEVADAFKPPGVEPVQFGAEILEGIEYRVGTLWDLAINLQQEAVNGLTVEGVRKVYEMIVGMPFVTQRPSRQISGAALRPKASLALWLSWGWNRDVEYWRKHKHDMRNVGEDIDFEPVRQALTRVGVPEALISQHALLLPGIGGSWRDVEKLQKAQDTKDWDQLKVIDMDGFINWANSSDVTRVLFEGLPKNLEWINEVNVKLQIRRTLPPFARRYLDSGSGSE